MLTFLLDKEPPTWDDCPTNIFKLIKGNEMAVDWIEPTATDNVQVKSQSSTKKPGDKFSVGTTIVRYTARDASLNSADCSFTVSIKSEYNTYTIH